MNTVTISKRHRIQLPESARHALQLRPGDKLQAVVVDERIVLVPALDARDLRGAFTGVETDVLSDEDRY